MSFYEQLNAFQQKLNKLEEVLVEVYSGVFLGSKKGPLGNEFFQGNKKISLGLTINHCRFKQDCIVIVHPEIPIVEIREADLDNLDVLRIELLTKQAMEQKTSKIHNLKFQIDYWTHQTSIEFITKKQQYIHDLQVELAALEGTK